jgi:hypothetical protein
MSALSLVFGTYNHQPDGTTSECFEENYQQSYKPFLSLLYKFPRLHTVLHYCGSLFEWMEDQHPEFIMLLKEMVRRKQVELLGGGYYAPILPLIPDVDKLGQIEKMSTFIRTTFGTRPRGSWLMERVWEPTLARILSNSGIEYTFLDDQHFRIAGAQESECYQPYRTEDQGKAVTVFPLHLGLQAMIPYTSAEDLIAELQSIAARAPGCIAVILVPGEILAESKWGASIYKEAGWLPSFFRLLEENRAWLHSVIPRHRCEVLSPRGRLYFPCLSSLETMNSALSLPRQILCQEMTKKVRRPENGIYLQRGFFRQFLTRYPEVGLLYSRLMYTHVLVNQIRGDKYRKKAALNEMWKGQTGAVYWHGRQGGAYSNNLRKAAYRAFNEAEKMTRNAGMFISSIIATDYDMDGREEYLYQGRVLNAFVHSSGAALLELDYLPKGWNYLDTIARWPEHYHRYKYEGCDWYMRKGFIDHFFAPTTTLEKFDRMSYQEMGDFINGAFQIEELKREQRKVVLTRDGQVRVRRRNNPLALSKSYTFKENGIDLGIAIRNRGTQPLELWYGLEFNLSLADPQEATLMAPDQEKETLIGPEPVDLGTARSVRICDNANRVQITFGADSEFSLWCLPVCTMSYIGDTLRKVYQCSCFLPQWRLELQPDQQEELMVSVDLRQR